MDISNVIYLLFFKFIDTILFYSTLKSNFIGFHQSQLQAILPKKGSHFEKKNEKMITIYVLDIPKYSFIILYSDNQKNIYAILFFGTLMTRRSEKNGIFWTAEGGNSFGKYFKNKPGNLISNFYILLGTPKEQYI